MSASARTFTPLAWTRLAWDSEQFGFPAARLTATGAVEQRLLALVLDECREEGIRHLIARVDAEDLSTIHVLERAGFELLDGIQVFALPLSRRFDAVHPSGLTVRPFQFGDRDQVLAIARSSYVYDRFHADSALTREIADRVNESWVNNCCRGTMADVVFVAEDTHNILGFVTCKLNSKNGVIGMVATLESARRRGVARAITAVSLNWFAQQGASKVEVGTQLANIPAARLYQSFNFRTVAVNLTFRKLLP